MRDLQESLTVSALPNLPITAAPSPISPRFYDWLFECHGFWHNVALIVPNLLFIFYLSFQAKKSFSKLTHGRSYVIIAYYACLWLASLLNLFWCSFQVLGFLFFSFFSLCFFLDLCDGLLYICVLFCFGFLKFWVFVAQFSGWIEFVVMGCCLGC